MSILNQITVVILSRERQHCLSRVIPFWERHGVKTLILDQSTNPLGVEVLRQLNLGTYLHINEPFRERCRKAQDMIDSKYSIVISDDELYVPSALKEMAELLENDPELVAVGAMSMAIWKYGPRTCGHWAYRTTHNYENLAEQAIERIRKHTNNGNRAITSFLTSNLNRTESLLDCLSLYSKSPYIVTEAASTLAICAAGKFKYVNNLYWIRNWNEPPRSNQGWDRKLMVHDWWHNRASLNKADYFEFEVELRRIFAKYAKEQDFEIAWNLILDSSRRSVGKEDLESSKSWLANKAIINYTKYLFKLFFSRSTLPANVKETLNAMVNSGVEICDSETREAIGIISGLYPYKNW